MRGVLEVPQIGINIDKFLAHFIPTIVRISMQLIPNPQHGSNLSSASNMSEPSIDRPRGSCLGLNIKEARH